MAKQVITREELNEIEPLDWSEKLAFWLKLHASKALTVLAIGFAAYAAYQFINMRKEASRGEASDMLYSAYQDYEKGLTFAWGTTDRVASMESARKKIDQLMLKHKGEAVSRNALFLKASTFYAQGDTFASPQNTQSAIRLLQQYEDEVVKSGGDAFEKAAAKLALGIANENLWLLTSNNEEVSRNALNSAMTQYDDIRTKIGKDAGFLYYEALNSMARVYTVFGERDDAIKLYTEVYKARHTEIPEPESQSQRQMMVFQLRQVAQQFTVGSTARIQLQRLGVDLEALDKEMAAETPAPKS